MPKLVKFQIAMAIAAIPGGVLGVGYFVSDAFQPIMHRVGAWMIVYAFGISNISLFGTLAINRSEAKKRSQIQG